MDDFGIKLIALSDYVEPDVEMMMDEIRTVVKKYNFATNMIKYGEWKDFIYRLVDINDLQSIRKKN